MQTLLISGAAGFIGSHVCDYFINSHRIIAVDNLITGSESNIQHLISNKNFEFRKTDITRKIQLNEKIDSIFHFASPASPKDYLEFPIETLEVGSKGTQNLLELAVKNDAKFLIASTSEVYGDPLEHPQNESYFGNVNPIGQRSVYDESKRFSEAIASAYKTYKNVDIRIARIFNTYGPRMKINDGRAIPNFINQSLDNKKITIYGSGNQTRSFCYISDTIEGIAKLHESNYCLPVNIGNPEEYTINELACIINNLTKNKTKFMFCNLPDDDPKVRRPDISLANNLLNWKPKISLKEGLEKTILHFKKIRKK